MKKLLLSVLGASAFASVIAQEMVSDTVSVGAGYANQVWYQLEDGSETTIAKGVWDIAFKIELMSASIFTNSGTQLWKHPGTIEDWAAVDTNGMAETWEEAINSPTDWQTGAFNAVASGDQFDYGWGNYDMATHNLIGSVFFIMKTTSGDYKKIRIDELVSTTGTYTFTYADLDGSNEQEVTFVKSDYADKTFGYYSLSTDAALDLEPLSADWDFYFTQYTDMVAMGPGSSMPYGVTGVLVNEGVELVQVDDIDVTTYEDFESAVFATEKNIIGYDWKSYDMESGAYVVADSSLYFVKDKAGSIWKVVFTGFGGNATGDFIFDKTLLEATSIEEAGSVILTLAAYPNPVVNAQVHLAFDLKQAATADIAVHTITGQTIWNTSKNVSAGLHTQSISTSGWASGIYLIQLTVEGKSITQKIIVQ